MKLPKPIALAGARSRPLKPLRKPPHPSRLYSTAPPDHADRVPGPRQLQRLALRGKTALVTGASRGIGRAIASLFAEQGARCLLVGRDRATLTAVLAALPSPVDGDAARHHARGLSHPAHAILTGDVGDPTFWSELVRSRRAPPAGHAALITASGAEATTTDGGERDGADMSATATLPRTIDILVNAAGVAHASPLFVTSEARIDEVVRTNLLGTIWACRSVGKAMLRLGKDEKGLRGCIINVASLLGLKGGQGSAAYAASKAGIIGLTRALAMELGPSGVRINALVPGYIDTDMTAAMTDEARRAALNAIPLTPPRFGTAEDVAHAALFLATNAYANNCVLNVDGGLSAT